MHVNQEFCPRWIVRITQTELTLIMYILAQEGMNAGCVCETLPPNETKLRLRKITLFTK